MIYKKFDSLILINRKTLSKESLSKVFCGSFKQKIKGVDIKIILKSFVNSWNMILNVSLIPLLMKILTILRKNSQIYRSGIFQYIKCSQNIYYEHKNEISYQMFR